MELRRQSRLRSDAVSDRLAGRTAVSDTAKTGSKPVPRAVDEGEESSPDAVNVCQASSSLVVHPNPAWCNGSISAFDSEDSRSNRDAGTTRQLGVGQWLASWPGTRTMGVRF